MRKLLSEALKLPARDRVVIAEKLLESVESDEQPEGQDDAAIQRAWADEVRRRSQSMKDGSETGLSLGEARRIVASDAPDDQH